MQSLKILNSKKELFFFIALFSLILLVNISYEYYKYSVFKSNKLFNTEVFVLNRYSKNDNIIYKLQAKNFTFFTSVPSEIKLNKLDFIDISIITQNISFYDYLKNFYAKSFNVYKTNKEFLKRDIVNKISYEHKNLDLSEFFQAIFLAIPTNNKLRNIFSTYSISHLIAISGFHLSVLSFVLYILISFPYNFFHNRYFPYRNKKFDILLLTLTILFAYLLFTNIVPSLLRAFIMFCFGVFLLRSNIKVISFQTLLLTLIFIIALFPKYIFSLSLWFSIIGVLYIFLFIKYFQNQNRVLIILFFNFWIFASFNPIVHYFFGITSSIQLISPILTLIFTIFYPFELFLHLIGYGDLLDKYLLLGMNLKFDNYEVLTPLWFFFLYLIASISSIFSKKAFIFLNILILGFNIFLYIKI